MARSHSEGRVKSFVLHTPEDRADAITVLRAQPLPCTFSLTRGARRSTEQNRLQRLWLNEAAEQLKDDTAEGYRAYCKLRFGVPLLRAENEAFREGYDAHVKGLPYETKLAIMAEPLDLPVTRLMTTDQKTRYLDAIYQHFTVERGVRLTQPKGT